MKKVVCHIALVLMLLLPLASAAQTPVVIPDDNFRQYLVANFPSVMDANNNLVKENAAVIQGTLDCSGKSISDLEGLQYFLGINAVNVAHNNLTTLPDLSALAFVTSMKFDGNRLTSFPILPRGHAITELHVQNNYLTFEDLLELATYNNISNWVLTPQKPVTIPATINTIGRNSLTIKLGIDEAENNTYSWSKNNVPNVIVTDRNVLEFSSLTSSDAGVYTCTITNDDPEWNTIGQPSLYTTVLNIFVDSCYSFSALQYASSPIECQKDGELILSSSNPNPQARVEAVSAVSDMLQLQGKSSQVIVYSSNNVFSGLKETEYYLMYKDTTGCELTKSGLIRINNNSGDCPEIILTPNGDGRQDELFIEDAGKIRIYNRSGLLVRELNGPVMWDGTDAQGRLAMGIYIIQTDKRTFNVYVYL